MGVRRKKSAKQERGGKDYGRKGLRDGLALSELEGRARDHALSWLAGHEIEDGYWVENVISDLASEITKQGYEDVKIKYSIGGGQGDGATFTGAVGLGEWLLVHDPDKYKELSVTARILGLNCLPLYSARCSINAGEYPPRLFNITVNRPEIDCDYCCRDCPDYCCDCTSDYHDDIHPTDCPFCAACVEIYEQVKEDHKEWGGKIYAMLEEEYSYVTSEEYLIDMAEANDWKFDAETGGMV